MSSSLHPDVPLQCEENPRQASARARVRVLDVWLDRVSLADVCDQVRSLAAHAQMQIVTANLQFIREARSNSAFAATVNDADLVVTDGRPLVWISRLLGAPVPQQITGHDLFQEFTALAAEEGLSVFLLGGGPGVAAAAAQRLQQQYPGLRVMGHAGGRFSSDGEAEHPEQLRQVINDFHPHFLFAALGCPKQDLWIARNLHALDARVCVGVGGVFDVYTGQLARAPRWMQRCGLESVFQLMVAPRRYAWRYLVEYPPTALQILSAACRQQWIRVTRGIR